MIYEMYRTGRVQYKGYSGLSDRSMTSTCDTGGICRRGTSSCGIGDAPVG